MDVDGAVALVDGAVIGFDVDLLSKKHYAVLRSAPFSFDIDSGIQGKLVVGVQAKSETMRLPKNRVGAEIVSYNGSVLILAHKKEGQQSLGYMFVEEDGKLHKLPGFAEGEVVEIASNESYAFARTTEGAVFYLEDGKKWKEFKTLVETPNDGNVSTSIDVLSLAACSACCFGSTGSECFFLFPKEGDCKVVKHNVDGVNEIDYLDGSGAYASFVFSLADDDPTNSFDADDEPNNEFAAEIEPSGLLADADDSSTKGDVKPAAVAK